MINSDISENNPNTVQKTKTASPIYGSGKTFESSHKQYFGKENQQEGSTTDNPYEQHKILL